MSNNNDDEKDSEERLPGAYKVGYKRPPLHSRFQKGQSGNPRGRPRGSKNKTPSLGLERLNAIIKEEAYREVEVTEQGGIVTMPIAQLAVRSLATKAAKGDHRSQRLITELVSAVESQDHRLHFEHMRNAMDYKDKWNMAIAGAHHRGEEPPSPLPHPDDIEICARTGAVRYLGPINEEEADTLAKVCEVIIDLQEEEAFFAQSAERARNPERKAGWEELRDETNAERLQLMKRLAPLAEKWPRHWPPKGAG